MYTLEALGVWKRYGNVVALEDVTIKVPKGIVYSIVGPNGAGKTTFLEGVLGLRLLDKGVLRLLGVEYSGRPPNEVLRRIGFVLDDMKMHDLLTVEENLKLSASLWRIRLDDYELKRVLEAVGMWDYVDVRYGKLSAGQKKRVDIAAALIGEPELLILDEPETNLDPAARLEIMELIREINARGVTVIFSSHSLELVAKYADRLAVIKRRIIAEGTPQELVSKFGGRWRLYVKSTKPLDGWEREGGYYVKELASPAEVAEALRGVEALDIKLMPPDLTDAFKKLLL